MKMLMLSVVKFLNFMNISQKIYMLSACMQTWKNFFYKDIHALFKYFIIGFYIFFQKAFTTTF